MDHSKKSNLPLVYSCSGCSNVAQLANDIAVKLNSDGIAEMSCIAGVGGMVKSLVKTAKSNRAIIVVDGCALQCARECLKNIDVEPKEHIILTNFNLKKKYNTKLILEDEKNIFEELVKRIKTIANNG